MQSYSTAVSVRPLPGVRFVPLGPAKLVSLLRHALAVARQRRRLALLTERELADVGLTREDALSEAARPFWDLPAGQTIAR